MSWLREARAAMERLIERGQPFTADDLLNEVGHPSDLHEANGRNSTIGSLFGEYSRAGKIHPVGVRASRQPERKGGMIRVWAPVPQRQKSLW